MNADDDRIRTSWSRFNEVYDELLELALARPNLDDGTRSAILRRLVANIQYSGLLLNADPAHPALINPQHINWSWGHPNPDTLYLSAVVDDAHDYRVHGRIGTVAQTTFGVYTGFADQSSAVKVLSDDLEIADDGFFEVFFTRVPREGNWYELPDGARTFGCYQTFGDWDRETQGVIRIECLNRDRLPGPEALAEAADRFDAHVEDSRALFSMWARDIPERMFKALTVNAATPPMQPPAAMAGAWFSVIPWELDDGEALVIDYRIPNGSAYVGICLSNDWGEMIDPRTRQTSLNEAQSQVDGDRVRVLLSTQDCSVHNWLDARGYRRGIATWRASVANQPQAPVVTKIRLDDVAAHFDGTTRVSGAERRAAIAARERHFAERESR